MYKSGGTTHTCGGPDYPTFKLESNISFTRILGSGPAPSQSAPSLLQCFRLNLLFVPTMEVTYVMTKEEWGKPIDVAEEWIHFVDDSVKGSELTTTKCTRSWFLLSGSRTTARQ